jgi:hypothetical protein
MRLRRNLALAALTLSAPAALACPSYNNPTVFGSANIPANFMPDPWVRNVTAGGRVSLQNCGFNFPGFVVSRPGFPVLLFRHLAHGAADHRARGAVERGHDPAGQHAGRAVALSTTTYRGTNSAITFRNPMQGQYDIWTGSYYRRRTTPRSWSSPS